LSSHDEPKRDKPGMIYPHCSGGHVAVLGTSRKGSIYARVHWRWVGSKHVEAMGTDTYKRFARKLGKPLSSYKTHMLCPRLADEARAFRDS
jgi:hypothetical protein